jgi:hypothetical protein
MYCRSERLFHDRVIKSIEGKETRSEITCRLPLGVPQSGGLCFNEEQRAPDRDRQVCSKRPSDVLRFFAVHIVTRIVKRHEWNIFRFVSFSSPDTVHGTHHRHHTAVTIVRIYAIDRRRGNPIRPHKLFKYILILLLLLPWTAREHDSLLFYAVRRIYSRARDSYWRYARGATVPPR